MDNQKTDSTPMILVIVLVLLGLVIAWFVFSNTDDVDTVKTESSVTTGTVDTDVKEEVDNVDNAAQDVVAAAKLLTARAQARTDLRALEAKIKTDKDYAAAEADLNAIETKLDAAYANATTEAKQDYVKIKAELNDMQAEAKVDASGILDSFAAMIALLDQ